MFGDFLGRWQDLLILLRSKASRTHSPLHTFVTRCPLPLTNCMFVSLFIDTLLMLGKMKVIYKKYYVCLSSGCPDRQEGLEEMDVDKKVLQPLGSSCN